MSYFHLSHIRIREYNPEYTTYVPRPPIHSPNPSPNPTVTTTHKHDAHSSNDPDNDQDDYPYSSRHPPPQRPLTKHTPSPHLKRNNNTTSSNHANPPSTQTLHLNITTSLPPNTDFHLRYRYRYRHRSHSQHRSQDPRPDSPGPTPPADLAPRFETRREEREFQSRPGRLERRDEDWEGGQCETWSGERGRDRGIGTEECRPLRGWRRG